MILTPGKEFKRIVSTSKRIFSFDDYYVEFLRDQMLDLKANIQKKIHGRNKQ